MQGLGFNTTVELVPGKRTHVHNNIASSMVGIHLRGILLAKYHFVDDRFYTREGKSVMKCGWQNNVLVFLVSKESGHNHRDLEFTFR